MKEERRSATRRREDYRALAGLRKAPSVAKNNNNNNNKSNNKRNATKSKKKAPPAAKPKPKTEYELELERNVEDVVNVIMAEVKLKEHNKSLPKSKTKSRKPDTTMVVSSTKVLPSVIASTTATTKIVKQREEYQPIQEQQNEQEGNINYTKHEKIPEQLSTVVVSAPSQPKRKRKCKSGTSSDEERWLDAIEAGKLVQIDDELKKIKDPKLMTARQRAMYDRVSGNATTNNNVITITETSEIVHNGSSTSLNCNASGVPLQFTNQLIALPTGYKEKVLTAEAIQKAQIKNQKRKQMADAKREFDKKRTMDRLLKKKETKVVKTVVKVPTNKNDCPTITYRSSLNGGNTIEFPNNYDLSRLYQKKRSPSPSTAMELCTICQAPKRYNYRKTNIPICSLKCYKQIGAMTKAMMC